MNPSISKILERFNNLNQQTRYAVFGGAVALVILLDAVFLISAQIGAINSLHDQMKKMSEDTQEVLTDRQRVNQLRKNLQMTRLELSSLTARVRPIQEVPAILSTISSIANDNGVKIDQLVPEKAQQETLTKSADNKYYALPIVIKAHCGYHMFGRFLNKLENENLYFIMKDFIIQNDTKDPQTHLFALTIKIILVDQTKNL